MITQAELAWGYGLIIGCSAGTCFYITYQQMKEMSGLLSSGLASLESMIASRDFKNAFLLEKEIRRLVGNVKKYFKPFLHIIPDLKWGTFKYQNVLDSLILESRKKFLDYLPRIQDMIKEKDFRFMLKQISIMEHNLTRIKEIGGHVDDIQKRLAEEREWVEWALENTQAWLEQEVLGVGEMINEGDYSNAKERLAKIKELAVKACLMKPTEKLRQFA